jgi:formylmethanofuran dehydrogenase subunit E
MDFKTLLDSAASFHGHLCGGQAMGVRMALAGLRELEMNDFSERENLMTFVEVERCIADAIQIVTGCTVGRRNLKLVNVGKFAATFVDVSNGKGVRISSRKDTRASAMKFAERNGWIAPGEPIEEFSQREKEIIIRAYSEMPESDMFAIEKVRVCVPKKEHHGGPKQPVVCSSCGELIFDQMEIVKEKRVFCRSCASGAYYENRPNHS